MVDIITLIKHQQWEQAMIFGDSNYYGNINDDNTWKRLLKRDRFEWTIMNTSSWGSLALIICNLQFVPHRYEQVEKLKEIIANSFHINMEIWDYQFVNYSNFSS